MVLKVVFGGFLHPFCAGTAVLLCCFLRSLFCCVSDLILLSSLLFEHRRCFPSATVKCCGCCFYCGQFVWFRQGGDLVTFLVVLGGVRRPRFWW